MIAIFPRMQISKKLPAIMITLAFLNAAILGMFASYEQKKEVIHADEQKLVALQQAGRMPCQITCPVSNRIYRP